jgi:hypothetical protein
MSNKKQSSIDWFAKKLAKQGLLTTEDSQYILAYLEAKAMHKEEIQDAYRRGFISDDIKLADDYYNERFGGGEQSQ